MLDGARNSTEVRHLQSLLIKEAIIIEIPERRLHCFGHILDLGVKYVLFGSDEQVFQTDFGNADDKKTEEFLKWRKLIFDTPSPTHDILPMHDSLPVHYMVHLVMPVHYSRQLGPREQSHQRHIAGSSTSSSRSSTTSSTSVEK